VVCSFRVGKGLAALALLVGLQYAITWLSVRSDGVKHAVKNAPRLLFHRGQFIRASMRRERVTEDQVYAAMRSEGILHPGDVEVVVLETDGSMSVIRRPGGR
jgi:uncharacterized membrane protein YcaP (DUF421 family)